MNPSRAPRRQPGRAEPPNLSHAPDEPVAGTTVQPGRAEAGAANEGEASGVRRERTIVRGAARSSSDDLAAQASVRPGVDLVPRKEERRR